MQRRPQQIYKVTYCVWIDLITFAKKQIGKNLQELGDVTMLKQVKGGTTTDVQTSLNNWPHKTSVL